VSVAFDIDKMRSLVMLVAPIDQVRAPAPTSPIDVLEDKKPRLFSLLHQVLGGDDVEIAVPVDVRRPRLVGPFTSGALR
ncbi:MAG: hypothetical protein HYS04_14425, partial [Acidobacteria bacterium]|nr:hypothetical protein [Acidobacteriota bacterium]